MQRIALSFIRSVNISGQGAAKRSLQDSSTMYAARGLATNSHTPRPSAAAPKPAGNMIRTSSGARIIQPSTTPGVRINKCFPEFSRTQVDRMINSGQVTVNGKPATLGTRLQGSDVVMLNGTTEVPWAQYVEKQTAAPYPEGLASNNGFVYIKYFKNSGVTTTTGRDPNGILNTGDFKDVKLITAGDKKKEEVSVHVDRLLPVGRLDNQSTGLMLLTSDPRLPSWLLGANTGCTKVYEVFLDRAPKAEDLAKWQSGISLSTASSTGKTTRVQPTLPCKVRILLAPSPNVLPHASADVVKQHAAGKGCWVQFVLKEGRNRQIRRMVHALGYSVRALHRASFCGVEGSGLKPGQWAYLTPEELLLLRRRK